MDSRTARLFVFAVAVVGALAFAGAFIRIRREASAARAGVLAAAERRSHAPARSTSGWSGRGGRDPRRGPLHDRAGGARAAGPGQLVAPLAARGISSAR